MIRCGFGILAGTLLCSAVFCNAQSTTYDLRTAEAANSAQSNPDAVWSLVAGSTLMSPVASPSGGCGTPGDFGSGFVGGPGSCPAAFYFTAAGFAAAQPGDLIVYSSDSPGTEAFARWTAPSAGNITISGNIWGTSSVRSNYWVLTINSSATALASGTVSPNDGSSRATPHTFSGGGIIAVNTGDVVSLGVYQTTGNNEGSFNGINLTITETPVQPSITGIAPSPVIAGSGPFTLSVTGSGFVSGSTVLWNGSPLTTSFVSAAQLTASIPASLIATVGTASITVSNSGVISNSQTLTITTLLSNLSRIGVLPQLAAGGGWDTAVYLTNTSAGPVSLALSFHADDGSALSISIAATQQGRTQNSVTSTLNAVIPQNTTLAVDTLAASATVQGWADVRANGTLTGFAVFRYAPQGLSSGSGITTPWEGTVPLQTQLSPTSMIVPFDNTNGFSTGVALGNLTSAPLNLTATFYDDNGNPEDSPQTIALAGNGHTSFLLTAQYSFLANTKGIMKVTGGALMGLGLRASPYGTLTAIPLPLQ
jgi:hypothetical protein